MWLNISEMSIYLEYFTSLYTMPGVLGSPASKAQDTKFVTSSFSNEVEVGISVVYLTQS